MNSIGSKIFNCSKFFSNIDEKAFLDNNFTLLCMCTNSPFGNKHHNHVITRNSEIINKNKLRKFFSTGTKYREHGTVDYHKSKKSIITE